MRNGAAAGHTVVNSGGTQIVPSEGHTGSTTVNAGGTQIISARQGGDENADKAGDPPKQDEGNKNKGGGPDDSGKGGGGDGKGNGRGRKILIRAIFLLVLVVIAIGGFIYWWSGRNYIDTDDAFTDGRAVTIAPRVSGKVIALEVNDNEPLKKGQVIVQLDPRDYQAAVDKASGTLLQDEGQLDQARIDLEKAAIIYPANLLEAQGNLEAAQANLVNAQQSYHRQHAISVGATTQQQIDAANAGLKQAEGQVKQAQGQVQVAQLVQQNIAVAQSHVKQLEGQVATAQAQLEQAKLNLSYTTVRAPQDGWVTMRNVEAGDYVQTGQAIMDLVVPEVWITANFKETQLTRMRPGQVVTINVDAYPSLHLKGHIGSIQMGSGSRFSAFPAENATGNFVKIVQRVPVKIIIDSGLDPNMPLPLGLSVEPSVNVTKSISNPTNGGTENEALVRP
ncbi:MAG: biotin/lipoyl-binding protein [Proteobacteria bacterium]|nr:biotin/lipoyl-binding protein [Pseudomonadota bacterium]